MKIQTLIFSLVINCVSSLSFNIAINQSAIAQTSSQIRKMRAVGVPVVLPSYIPNGFRLTNFKIGSPSDHAYETTYKGPNNCEISVTGADGGWGATGPVREWTVNTQLYGKVILEEWDGSNTTYTGPNYFMAGVLPNPNESEKGKGGVIKGFPKAGYLFVFSCDHSVFSRQTATRILQSARLVK
jgi:hypothetical protein